MAKTKADGVRVRKAGPALTSSQAMTLEEIRNSAKKRPLPAIEMLSKRLSEVIADEWANHYSMRRGRSKKRSVQHAADLIRLAAELQARATELLG